MRRPVKRRPPAQPARNVIQGGSGGLLGGALLGLTEAIYHLVAEGVPDLVSPFYGVVLYSLMGLPLGLLAGVALTLWERVLFRVEEENAWAVGFAGGIAPPLTFVLYYLANKVWYLERGVPLEGKGAVLILGLGIPLLFALVLPFPLHGGLAGLRKARGMAVAYLGLLLVTGALAEAPILPDPRDHFAAGKHVPGTLRGTPDVIVLFVDTLRADALQPYGSEVPTPAMQALADDGVVFEHAFAQASWTRASGASLLSSRLPSCHGAATKAARLPGEIVTFPEVLHDAGVTTGALINNINLTGTFGFDQGWDTFYYEAPEYPFAGTESVFALTFYKVLQKGWERAGLGSKRVETYYQPADVVLGDAKAFIEANNEARWTLFVHLMEPHDPYFEHPSVMGTGDDDYNGVGIARAEVEHPDPSQADYMRKIYSNEVMFLDRHLAGFVAWLKETGRYDNTLIVLTADHGEEFQEHGGWWHGTTLYDEQIHVPLIVKLPGGELAGTRAPWQVRSIDIAPTITAALGLPADASWEGRDLIAEVRAEAEAAAVPADVVPADAVPAEPTVVPGEVPPPDPVEPASDAAVPTHPRDRVVVAEEDFEGNVLAAIRKDGFKVIRANEGNPRGLPTQALFDVAYDPDEAVNLLGTGTAIDGRYPEDIEAALVTDLGAVLSECVQVTGEDASISAAECERLKALGYVAADEPCE